MDYKKHVFRIRSYKKAYRDRMKAEVMASRDRISGDIDLALVGVGPAIRSYRKSIGMSQVDLATAAGIEQSMVSLIESGKNINFMLRTYIALEMALGVSPGVVLAKGGCDASTEEQGKKAEDSHGEAES